MDDAGTLPPGFRRLPLDGGFYDAVGGIFGRLDGNRLSLGFRVAGRHINAADICHGGMLATVADIQLGVASALEADIDAFLVTVNLNTDYLRSARLGEWVEANSRVLRRSRSLVFAEGLLTADGEPCLRANAILRIPREMPGFPGSVWDLVGQR